MKRSLFIAIAVLIVMALFVGCKADIADRDELVEVSVTTDSARALSMAAEANNVPVADLYWFYTAEKKDNSFKTGETRDPDTGALVETAVKSGTGLLTDKLGDKFSKGAWEFKFYAYVAAADKGDATKRVYSAETTTTLKTSIALSLTLKAETVAAASIYMQGVTFTSDLIDSVYDSVKLFVTPYGATAGYEGTKEGSTLTFAAQEIRLDTEGVEAGSYQIAFTVKGYIEGEEPETIGLFETSVQVVAGMKYTISGAIDAVDVTSEIGIGEAEAPVTTSERVTETLKNDAAVTFTSPNNPKAAANETTTVTFPEGSFTAAQDGAEAILTVTAYNTAAAQGNFQIQGSDNKPIAGLDLSLTGATSFNGQYARVTTYIGEGYVNPTVVYDGTGEQPIFVSYENGYITFDTSHFSSFYVFAAEAMIGNVAYTTISEALAAVPTDGTATTITLLKDATAGTLKFNGGKNVVLDLGGYKLTADFTYVLNGSLTVKNGTINGIYVYGLDTDDSGMTSYLNIAADAVVDDDYSIVLNEIGTKTAYDATIDVNGTLTGWIWVMGNIINDQGDCVINVNSGAQTANIALQGYAILNINEGATVTGPATEDASAIEVRSGVLNVNGGTITCNYDPTGSQANNNGTSTAGAGIGISQYNNNSIMVTLKGGVISGDTGLYWVHTFETFEQTTDVRIPYFVDDNYTIVNTVEITGRDYNHGIVIDRIYSRDEGETTQFINEPQFYQVIGWDFEIGW